MSKLLRNSSYAAIVAAMAISQVAVAQDRVSSGVDESSDEAKTFETITVTARFREESAEDLGQSIRPFGDEELEQLGINSVSGLAQFTPSLSIQDRGAGRNEISIRGVGRSLFQQDLTPASPNIGLYYDDVPINIIAGPQLDVASFGLQRVEVLRGPQGTLFGEGAQGGAIRFVTQDPNLSEHEGVIEVAATTIEDGDSDFAVRGTVSFPIIEDKLGIRLTAGRDGQPGYIDNTFDGEEDTNSYESSFGRVVVLAEPNDKFRARASYQYAEIDQDAYGFVTPTDPERLEYDFVSTANDYTIDESHIASLNLSYDFGKFELVSISSYYERERERDVVDQFFTVNTLFNVNLDNTFLGALLPAPISLDTVFPTTTQDTTTFEQLSQEFRVISQFDGPFNFVAGAFYRDFELDIRSSSSTEFNLLRLPLFEANLLFNGIPFTSPANPSTNGSILAEQLGLNEFYGISEVFGGVVENGEQFSVFFEGTYEITDALRVTAGLRAHEETIDLMTVATPGLSSPLNAPVVPRDFVGDVSVDEILPRVLVEYDFTDSILGYATYSEGIRNGNVNGGGTIAEISDLVSADLANDIQTYDPEEVRSYEVGVKGRLFDDRLYFAVAGYYNELIGIQGTATVDFTTPAGGSIFTGITENLGDGFAQGFEVEANLDVTDHFRLFAGGSVTESEIEEIEIINPLITVRVADGQRTPFIPDYSFNFGGDFDHPLENGFELFGNANYSHVGEYSTFHESPEGSIFNPELGDYGTVNLGLGVRNDRFSVDLKVMNATNEIELIQAAPTSAIFNTFSEGATGLPVYPPQTASGGLYLDDFRVSRPRTFVVTLRTEF